MLAPKVRSAYIYLTAGSYTGGIRAAGLIPFAERLLHGSPQWLSGVNHIGFDVSNAPKPS